MDTPIDPNLDYTIGSQSYDADMDFVKNYVLLYNGIATEDQAKFVFEYYKMKAIEYINIARNNFIKSIEIYTLLRNRQDLQEYAKMEYDDVRQALAEATGQLEVDLRSIVDNYRFYRMIVSEESPLKINVHRDTGEFKMVEYFENEFDLDPVYKLDYQYALDQIPDLLDHIRSLTLHDSYKEVTIRFFQSIFDLTAQWMCSGLAYQDIQSARIAYYKEAKYPETCYLPNTTGLFGLNTYLYAYFHGVYIIGVPTSFQDFDGNYNKCPYTFITHDSIHTSSLRTRPAMLRYKSMYTAIILDPELTRMQKEELIMILWVSIHEGVGPINFLEDIQQLEPWIKSRPSVLFNEFFEEFNRFWPLLSDPTLFEQFKPFIGNRIEIAPQGRLVGFPSIDININNLTEFRNFVDDPNIDIHYRGRMFLLYLGYYAYAIINKYYKDTIPV